MKTNLLITTALVAVLSTANVYAMEINTDTTIVGEDQSINTSDTLTVSDGTLTATDSAIHASGIMVTGGNTILNGTDFTNDDLSKSFELSDGTITMNGNISVIGTNHGEGDDVTNGKFEMSGGNIIVNGSQNYIEGGDLTVSGGTIDIAQGATLQTVKTIISNDVDADPDEIAVIKLKDTGAINLSGKLIADITSDTDSGELNFKTSSAVLDGDFTNSNLNFDASHSMSKAITGTVHDINNLNINKGIFNFDKETTGTITTVKVGNGATLDIGNKTLVSTGDVDGEGVIFADNSSLNFQVSGIDNHGKIKADLIKISETGTNLNLTLDTGVLKKDQTETFTILDSSNITGAFANLSKNARYEFVDNGDGTFDITGKATAGDVVNGAGGNANNAGTATAWDNSMPAQASATAKSVQSALNNLSQTNPQAYVAALTALAPEANGATASTSVEGANQVFGAVGTRLSGGSVSGSKQGMASGDNSLDKGAMWVQGLFNKAKLDKTDGFDADSNGLALGFEKNVTDASKVGVGYAYSNTDIDSTGKKTDIDTHSAIVYGEYKPNNWYVNGIATYSWGAYDEKKNVAGIPVKAKYDVDSIALQAMTGYDFVTNLATVTPEVGLRYVNIKQDAYTDSADQSVASKTDNVWTGVAGVKFAKDYGLNNGMVLKPEARFALTYDMSQADSSSVVSLANGSVYSADASPLKRFGQEVGLGLTAEINDNVELSAGYEGRFRSYYTDHTGMFNAKYKF